MNEPRREQRTLVLLLGLAVVLRASYLLEYTALPFLDAPLYDSVVYLRQAQAVLSGDFGHATLLAYSPLYGYFLALVGVAASLVAPVIAQFVLGVAEVALVYVAARRLFGARAAAVSASLWLGYGLLAFYETKILSETLGLALALAAFTLYLSKPVDEARTGTTVAAGAVLGLAVLARASLLFSAPLFVLAALVPRAERTGEKGMRRSLWVLLGLALVLGGNGFWNLAHTGFFVPVTFVSDTVRVSASHDVAGDLRVFSRDASGDVSPWDVVRQADERMHGTARAAAPLSFDFVGYLQHAPSKAWRTFSDLELTFYEYGYYGERSEIRTLRVLPVTFGMFVLLGTIGAVCLLRRRGWRALVPYAPLLLGPLATTTLFHPDSRYRLAMIIPAVFLAGLGVETLATITERRRRIAAVTLVAVICALLAARTLTYRLAQPAVWELSVAESAAKLGDAAEVSRRITRARADAPGDPGIERRIAYVLDRLSRSRRGP